MSTIKLTEAILFACLFVATKAALPPGVNSCPVTDDLNVYNACVLQQLEALRPYLPKGIAALRLPALDPLLLPSLTIDRNLEALTIRANMTSVRVFGASNFLVKDMKADPSKLSVNLKVVLPHVHVNGDYDVQGRLLLLPLNGAGSFSGNFTNTQANVIARGKPVSDKNGVARIAVDDVKLKIRVGDGNIKLDAPRTALAADAAANFFNSNPRLVLDIATPIIEDTAATISRALATRALNVLTQKELLP